MVENNYDVLDAEIGEIGEDKPLKKLKHKASYGQKEDLTSDEQSKLDAFLARSNSHKNQDSSPISQGWIPIDREEMGMRSTFYPESWEFMIRPATVQAIKNWTAIDEERPDVMNSVFNEIADKLYCAALTYDALAHEFYPEYEDRMGDFFEIWTCYEENRRNEK